MGQRGWRRVNQLELLPPPVRTAFHELAMLESSSEMPVLVEARAIIPTGPNIRRTVEVRSWPVGDVRHGRYIRVRTNVNRTRKDWPYRNHYAGVSLRRIDADQHHD